MFGELDSIYNSKISALEDNMYRRNMILYTSVWFCRIAKANYIKDSHANSKGLVSQPIVDFVSEVEKTINLSIPNNEIEELQFMLSTLNPHNVSNTADWVQGQILSLKLVEIVKNEFDASNLSENFELQEALINHVIALLVRLRLDIQFYNPLKDTIIKEYGELYKAVKKINYYFKENIGKELNNDEITFLAIHFLTFYNDIRNNQRGYYRAIVICHHGKVTGRILAENLKKLF
ncbi:PRD domain-containing protein [Eremococcus coleocola]|uniref:PRD domain-containing protein n=1 Tax=Eremococcus coleocola TaxID=88132 RepID=UPI0003F9FCDE|nr:PRD domain-containing protein [Eremococcus coleocola]